MAVSYERRLENENDARVHRRRHRKIARETALQNVQEAIEALVKEGAPVWFQGEQAAAYQDEVERLLSRI